MLRRYIFFFSLLLLTTLGISPSAGFSGFMSTAPNIVYGSAGKTIASNTAKVVAELGKGSRALGNIILKKKPKINKANHVFGPKVLEKHNLGGILDKFSGDQVKAFQSLEKAAQKLASQGKIDGVFESVVKVKGVNVTIRGKVIDGIANIGTAFIP